MDNELPTDNGSFPGEANHGSPESHPITLEIKRFVEHIFGLPNALSLLMTTMGAALLVTGDEYLKFLEDHGELVQETTEKKLFHLEPQYFQAAKKLRREQQSTMAVCNILPRSFILTLVSQYDAFLGRLTKCLIQMKPELLNVSDRQLTFSQLSEFIDINQAREFILEKEIESVLRKSHPDQFVWLENKFSIPLKKDLPIWSTFVEVMERRNLFAHCDGVVSSQYLSVCQQHGVKFEQQIQIGDQLSVTPEYFKKAHDCIFEIGIKLAQVLWRKLSGDALLAPDRSLIEITYDLLVCEEYDLAITLLDFAVNTLKKHHSDEIRRVFIINRAQASKWLGKEDECRSIISEEDWSACSDKFKLGVAVLFDNFDEAAMLMKQIGPHGEVEEKDYKDWPLFRKFRQSEEFLNAFEYVFGRPFATVAEAPTQLNQIEGECTNQIVP